MALPSYAKLVLFGIIARLSYILIMVKIFKASNYTINFLVILKIIEPLVEMVGF